MNLKNLVTLTQETLERLRGPAPTPYIDIRTIRYYEYNNNLEFINGKKDGRENEYAPKHFKQLILIKHMQSKGYSLQRIKTMKKLDETLEAEGFDVRALDQAFHDFEAKTAPKEETTVKTSRKESKIKKAIERAKKDRAHVASKSTATLPDEETLQVAINGGEYTQFRESLRLGSAFAFVDGLKDEAAQRLHTFLNGARAGKGEVSRAVIAVDDGGIALPGCQVTLARALGKDAISLVLPDKDVYKEGDDTARLFVFDPSVKSTKQFLSISINGAQLDRLEVDLDANGCGIARFPTLISGSFEAKLEGRPGKCSFSSARYELAPFTVHATDVKGKGDKVEATLEAETFGSPYEGKATMVCLDDAGHSAYSEVKFKEGLAVARLDLAGYTGAVSLTLSDMEDHSLVASTPLRGLRKEEREDSAFSQMGKVVTASLLPRANSFNERGLNFEVESHTNTPLLLKSVVSRKIEVVASAAAELVTILVRNPITGASKTHEVGSVAAGRTLEIDFDGPVAFVNIGAFVGGRSWEGHATVLKAVGGKVAIEAPSAVEPGESLTFKVKAPKGSSVLVKISDKRLRAKDEPCLAAAAAIKAWVSSAFGKRKTGFLGAEAPLVIHRAMHFGSGALMGGGIFAQSAVMRGNSNSYGWSADNSIRSFAARRDSDAQMLCSTKGNDASYYSGDVEVKTAGGIELPDHIGRRKRLANNFVELAGMSGNLHEADGTPVPSMCSKAKKEHVREVEADVLYCDLLEVSDEREVKVDLPDSIGLYDVKAFGVSGEDWSESSCDVRVEKQMYVEPLIPQFAMRADEVNARAVVVKGKGAMLSVRVDGKPVEFKATERGDNVHLSWAAVPGVHEVSAVSGVGNDKVRRVVEEPGEEIVLTQEMLILKKGQSFDLSKEDALSVSVLPSIDTELKASVYVCVDFSHSCCEQTSAKVVAAVVAYLYGDDSGKDKAHQALVNGEARLRSMFHAGKGFDYYPGGSLNAWASQLAAMRILAVKDAPLGSAGKKALAGMVEMAKAVAKVHGEKETLSVGGKAEFLYSAGRYKIPESLIEETLAHLKSGGYYGKAEACYCAAALLKSGELDRGIEVANVASKAMGSANGGGMHGTCECLAYMHMVNELRAAGVVTRANGTSVAVDGEKMTVAEASRKPGPSVVEALSTVAIRVNRIKKIRFEDTKSSLPIEVRLAGEGGAIRAGRPARLTVKIDGGYKAGDVLCVRLPDGISQVVGGAKAKKVQIDFAGKDQIDVDLVAHDATGKPQHWAAVVRNMYDEDRIGSVGELTVSVAK